MYLLQFQTRVTQRCHRGAEEPTTYFLTSDNLAQKSDLFYFDVKEKCFAIRVIVISFTFNEPL